MLTGKRKLRKPYIITEKASVRKGLRAIMSFPYISRLIWTAMCPPFAQWHGMPDRTLVQTPEGEVKKLTVDEYFIKLDKTTIFKKNTGYEKVAKLDKLGNPMKDKKGNPVYKAGKKNGWLVQQGGYPPLAFGFPGSWSASRPIRTAAG